MRFDAFADRFHDFQIDAQKVIPAHARLARHTGRHDTNICACNVSVIVGTFKIDGTVINRCGLGKIQGFALWHSLGNIKQDNIPELFARCDVSECSPDHS